MTLEKPLVSVIVITYNSAKYVLDTLESVKTQTYQNIELIVSDDCSTDNTVEICQNWIDDNRTRFVRTMLITNNKNTGIPANCNRGLYFANGEWLKYIAGDDAIVHTCIEDYIKCLKDTGENIYALHANINVYKDTFDPESFIQTNDYSDKLYSSNNISAKDQYSLTLTQGFIGAPSVFLNRELIIRIGGWDETMPYEDWPMFLSIHKHGYKIHYLNKVVAKYRIHGESIFNNNACSTLLFNDFFFKDRVIYKKYRRGEMNFTERLTEDLDFYRKRIMFALGMNRNNLFNRQVNNLLNKFFHHIRQRRVKRIEQQILKNMRNGDA